MLHSDRGTQFTSEENQQLLKGHNVICSMSGVGSCARTTQPLRASSACSSVNASTAGGTSPGPTPGLMCLTT